MKCIVFGAATRQGLEEKINTWLAENPVSPDSFKFEYGVIYREDGNLYALEHTVVLFYVPMKPLFPKEI